ncbi:MAG: hypothetical protein ACYDA6_09325, partial [Solirubrobacteraceae bacterium]
MSGLLEAARTTPPFRVAVAVAVAATATVAVWIGLGIGGRRTTLWVDDCATPAAAALALISCLRARARHEGRLRLFWSMMSWATALWTFAEVTWGVYPLILGKPVPSPSWADVSYLAAVVVVVAGLVIHPAIQGGGTHKLRSVIDGIAVATALSFLSWTFVLGPLWRSSDLSTASGLVTAAYPFADVVIVFFIVLGIRRMGSTERAPLWWLLGALLILAGSDSAFTYLSDAATYNSMSAHLVDTGWIAAYLGIALAAIASRGEREPVASVDLYPPSLASMLAPLMLILVALTAVAVRIEL